MKTGTAMAFPDLGEILGATIAGKTCFDGTKRGQILGTLSRMLNCVDGGPGPDNEVSLPFPICRSLFPDPAAHAVMRTGVGYQSSGPGGLGSTLKVDYTDEVWDRQRTRVGPLDLAQWVPMTSREYAIPVSYESTTASPYGGFTATFGLGETVMPAAVDARSGQVILSANRLLIFTQVSADLWQDSARIHMYLSYVAKAAIRSALEQCLLAGITGGPTPLYNSQACYTVPKGATASNAISVTNIQNMWEAFSEASSQSPGSCWVANKQTVGYIDTLASGGQFPPQTYFPAGAAPNGQPFGQLYGRPVLQNPWSPKLGNPGDLLLVDFADVALGYIADKRQSPLSFYIDIPDNNQHTGVLGLRDDAVEQRISRDAYFSTDVLAIVWKMRCDVQCAWSTTSLNSAGQVIAPIVVTAQR